MSDLVPAHLDHRRLWADFDYCYPVLSRRSRGVSLGVNLNPDKACNFDCVYCEVDRTTPAKRKDIDLDQLEREMAALLDLTLDGTLFRVAPFDSARPEQRRLNDIAFSGDGEPTTAPEFADAVDRIAHLKWQRGLEDVKLVLITDSSRLTARDVVRGLDVLMANHGEIWAKLDAGTEGYYQAINRTAIPFARVLEAIETTARLRPLTIQSLFLSWKGEAPSKAEIAAYAERLAFIRRMGGQLQGLQLYTVARPTPEAGARPLQRGQLDAIAEQVRAALPEVPVEVFYGPDEWPEKNVHGL
jgi:wyosine [tRNA(Phe)-imidazoG37] synthetase (radical SAM superfamily)